MNTFLRRWFQAFPHFQGADFFVSGESFAGVYVPLVSQVGGAAVREGEEACMRAHACVRALIRGGERRETWPASTATPSQNKTHTPHWPGCPGRQRGGAGAPAAPEGLPGWQRRDRPSL